MIFEPHISYDGLIALLSLLSGAALGYFGVVRRVDRIHSRQDALEKTVSDLKRGRGLILGDGSDWPDPVRRCFGFGLRHGRE